jgi:Domain of unknown function (DUF4349)/Putative zinc-finger
MIQAMHPFEQEEIMAYLDGETSAERASAVAMHLRECAKCEALTESLHKVSQRLTTWTIEPVPEGLSERVTAATKQPSVPRMRLSGARHWFQMHPWSWAVAGACCVLLAAVIFGVVHPNLLRLSARDALLLAQRQTGVSAPAQGISRDQLSERESAEQTDSRHQAVPGPPPPRSADARSYKKWLDHDVTYLERGPLIARSASLSITAKDFGTIEAVVKGIAERHKGYIAELNTTAPQDTARTLSATLKIPAPQLDAALAELKQLGRVEQEQQSGEEVTKQYTDLAAQLKNSRATEERLLVVLRDHTGKVKDILEAEQEIARVRGEIEEMEADQRALQTRIDFATVQLSLKEDYKASLQVAPPSTPTRLHNAAVQGFRGVTDDAIDFILWLLEFGPSLLLWGTVLFFPARWAWKRWRRVSSQGELLGNL